MAGRFLKDIKSDFAHLEDLLRLATAQARAADEQIQETWATKDVYVFFVLNASINKYW